MTDGPQWVELTRTVGEINARLIAGDLENEEIRTHIELEGSAWFYAAEDPNRLATIYVLAPDLQRAEAVLQEASEGSTEVAEADEDLGYEDEPGFDDADVGATGSAPPILAKQDSGLRSRSLRWVIAAVVLGALLFGFMEGSLRELLR